MPGRQSTWHPGRLVLAQLQIDAGQARAAHSLLQAIASEATSARAWRLWVLG